MAVGLKSEGRFELVDSVGGGIVAFVADKGAWNEGPSVMVRYYISGEVYTYSPDRAREVWDDLVSKGFMRGQS
tara:strand:- start:285 stop:503 length:219 start_codon:yes stop_codon:yes gene_type:complete